MIQDLSTPRTTPAHRDRDRSLRRVLWTLWTLATAGTAAFYWYGGSTVGQAVDLLGLVIYTALGGIIGLLAITIIELWLEPQRFLD